MYYGYYVPLVYIIQTVTYCNDVEFHECTGYFPYVLGQNSQHTSQNFEYSLASYMSELPKDSAVIQMLQN